MKKVMFLWLLIIFLVIYAVPLAFGGLMVLLNHLIRKIVGSRSLRAPEALPLQVKPNETRRVA